jgi:hypothetical protein
MSNLSDDTLRRVSAASVRRRLGFWLLAWTAYSLLRSSLTLLADPGTDPNPGELASRCIGAPRTDQNTLAAVLVFALALTSSLS